jgi:hypothetical protein
MIRITLQKAFKGLIFRVEDMEDYLRTADDFTASNGYIISASSYPDIECGIGAGRIYVRGANRESDMHTCVYRFADNVIRDKHHGMILVALKEWADSHSLPSIEPKDNEYSF